jgi:hypothetical protein
MTHRKLAAALAAVLFAGSASTGLAQGTRGGRAPSPGIGGGGTGFTAPSPGIGTGGMAPSLTPTPGIGTGSPPNITPTPGIGTTPNPSGTLTGGPPSAMPSGEGPPSEKAPRAGPPNAGPASAGEPRTLADIKEETEAGLTYQPCPANVRFPNGQQMCLGLPGPFYRPYHPPKQP